MTDIEQLLTPQAHDLGGLTIARVLPAPQRRMVGPFIFLDHIGPAIMPAGSGLDVRPHPHIGLSTLTFLFEGEIFHRDSLGNALAIRPGAVNWMTAGRGIAHSERTSETQRGRIHSLHGLQCWVALPKKDEETDPEFLHYEADAIPHFREGGVELRLVAGEAYGLRSPVKVYSPLFYIDVHLDVGAEAKLPDDFADRALYVIEGGVEIGNGMIGARTLAVLGRGSEVVFRAHVRSHVLLLGGAPFPEERHIWWNFVSSSQARIAQAKADWKAGRFAPVGGDDKEFIPLPD